MIIPYTFSRLLAPLDNARFRLEHAFQRKGALSIIGIAHLIDIPCSTPCIALQAVQAVYFEAFLYAISPPKAKI